MANLPFTRKLIHRIGEMIGQHVLSRVAMVLSSLVGACGGAVAENGAVLEELRVLSVREDFRVGSVDDPEMGFSWIGHVTVGPDASTYVLERRDQQVRVYDQIGRRIRTIGRKGAGPGEFTGAYRMGFKADTLWIHDQILRRTSLLTAEGELLSTFPLGLTEFRVGNAVFVRMMAGPMRHDGWFTASAPEIGTMEGLSFSDSVFWLPTVVFDRRGQVVDTAGMGPWSQRRLPRMTIGGRETSRPAAPPDGLLHVLFADGSALIERAAPSGASEAVLTVTRLLERGDTVYRRSYRYLPRRFEPTFVNELIWQYGEYLVDTSGMDSTSVVSALRTELQLPPYQPPVSRAVAGEDGSLWLRREEDAGSSSRWLVFDPDGRPVGQLGLPRSARIHWARGDVFYAEVTDELDVPWLVRYRVGK